MTGCFGRDGVRLTGLPDPSTDGLCADAMQSTAIENTARPADLNRTRMSSILMPFRINAEVTFVKDPSAPHKPAMVHGVMHEVGGIRCGVVLASAIKNPVHLAGLRGGRGPDAGTGSQEVAGCVVIQFVAGTLRGRISR